MPRPHLPLDERFRRGLRDLGLHGTGARVLVALSGGCDSVALLHLLRFHTGDAGIEVAAAHFDHGMRPGSEGDARWCAGLCRAWGVPLLTERSGRALCGEADAREARYAFLREAAAALGCTHVATAHHADDQAETVLFRALRGTGIAGLGGIAPADGTGLVRPLLPFWRREIARWARARGLRWRRDPSNRSDAFARNRIRRRVLPLLERTVAPAARRSLVRLAALAREEAAAWDAVLAPLLRDAAREEDGAIVLVRRALAGYDTPVSARILRALLRRLGVVPGRAGTRRALQFITTAPSGRELRLPGGVRIATEFGEARIQRVPPAVPAGADRPLEIPGPGPGEGSAVVGGRELRVRWRTEPWHGAVAERPGRAVLALEGLCFPLVLRGRAAGDRVRTRAGTRPLKKLLCEARIPRGERDRLPVLACAGGSVLWAGGAAQAAAHLPRGGEPALVLDISHTRTVNG
jgi:tRNA(Ile)-lysidine synthase